MWGGIAAALILLIAAYKTGAWLTSEKGSRINSNRRFMTGTRKARSPAHSFRQKLKLNETNVKPLLAYAKKHDELLAALRGNSSEKMRYTSKRGKTLLCLTITN